MDMYETVFMVSLFIVLLMALIKLLNVIAQERNRYGFNIAVAGFIINTIAWGITLFISIVYYDVTIVMVLFQFSTMFFIVNVFLFIVELIILISQVAGETTRGRYNPLEKIPK